MMMRWTYMLLFLGMLSLQAHPWLHDSHGLVQADQLCVGCHMAEQDGSVGSAGGFIVRPAAGFVPRPASISSLARAAAIRRPEIRGPPATLVS